MKQFLLGTTAAIVLLMSAHARAEQMVPYKSNWRSVEASNGAVYKIDMNSISYMNNGAAELIVYIVEGDDYDPRNVKRLWFDCHGHYRDQTNGISATLYAPPRSMAGQLSGIACAGAKDTRFDEPPKDAPRPEPKWTDYCKDFSEQACTRIRTVVEAKITPSYCKPSFGIVPTSLSPEQLRICYVMPPLKTAAAPSQSTPTRTAQQPTALPASASPQNFKMKLSALYNDFPSIIGDTNLPDETKLMVSIKKPHLPNAAARLAAGLAMCEDNCIPASGPKGQTLGTETTVLSGAFSAGPFSWNGKPFRPGSYEVEVFLVTLPGEDLKNMPLPQFEQWADRMKKAILTQQVTVAPK
jgi:hypothetical protein